MFEESASSIPSLWASMNSWFTPTVLFVLLNLMIGTIAITSSLTTQNHHQDPAGNHRQLARSPSVLQRLKSNFYSYRSQEPTTNFLKSPENDANYAVAQTPEREQSHFARSPVMLQRLKSNFYSYISQEVPAEQTLAQEPPREEEEERLEEDGDQFDQAQTLDEIYSQLKDGGGGGVSRSKSDTKPTAGEPAPPKLSRKMKKSASAKSAFAHFEEADIVEARRPATVREGKVKAAEVDDDEVDAKADDFINKFKQQLKLQRLDSFMRYKEMIGRGSGE
ncbi:hypothetical protein L484_019501 [Morus notabilis]|uniref:DUF4408 domain-containing protein n=1 Tax=Morus notabilis TaxID=981085 RepID=W9RBN7_9ROSA|nr:uncharacterized protein LOC21402440 [Morus notabilis]EXB66863.1 hypothetical protein L484_019501 [Morus notabilis]